MGPRKSSYAAAGVDIDRMTLALDRVRRDVRRTRTPAVLSEPGSFGGLFRAPGRDTVLVSSIDGVGTKLMVAALGGRHMTVGEDLVNHCVNDILVHGAHPLFFLDYLGTARLEAKTFREVLSGICRACRRNGCALLGGETAEMPGLYPRGEYDLVGAIVGAVRRRDLVTGRGIRAGDVLVGLASSGLHTNGYSLAREVLFRKAGLAFDDPLPGSRRSVGQALLAVHRSYLKCVQALMKAVKVRGLAHITGGGLVDNVPRVLPDGLLAVIDRAAWRVPALFRFLEETGRVDREEMYRVFNMGIGMVLILRRRETDRALSLLRRLGERPRLIGRVEKGAGGVQLLN